MLGVERKTATEYSFFAAVPIMIAATCFEFYKKRELFHAGHIQMLAIGFVVSFVVAWLAVKFFIRFLGRHTLVAVRLVSAGIGGGGVLVLLRR